MITLLIGENSFEVDQALSAIAEGFDGRVERVDGSQLTVAQLPDILMGVSLFAEKRVVVIKNLGENKSVWSVFGDWIPKISDDIHLVLVEAKPDKRTVTYKALSKAADVREFAVWTDRDTGLAEKWVMDQAKTLDLVLDKKSVQTLVQWVGVEQWSLYHALQKLACVDVITPEVIHDIVPANPVENVFNLFETALSGNIEKLTQILRVLEQTEDVFRLSALLSSQAFQLAAVWSADKSDNVVKDFGIHPYVVQRMTGLAKKLGRGGVSKIITIFTELDDDLKTSRAEPWLLVERALINVS